MVERVFEVRLQHIAGLYMSLLLDNIKGPSTPISSILPSVISRIKDPFDIKSPKERCLNYDTFNITCALQQLHFTVNSTDHYVSIDDNNEGSCRSQQETTTYNINDSQTVGLLDNVSAKKCQNSKHCYCAPCKGACIPSQRQLFHGQTGTILGNAFEKYHEEKE
jgi:hypothetical protein